jgi:Protein of unknown function (DUF4013)
LGASSPGPRPALRNGYAPVRASTRKEEIGLNRIADSFSWPFRGSWRQPWLIGVIAILFLPLTFVLVLGYAVAAVSAAGEHSGHGPPPWRLYPGGAWVALALVLLTAPFVLVGIAVSNALHIAAMWHSNGTLLDVESFISALLILALPWGVVVLLLMPHATARYAATHRARDLFAFASSLRGVRRDFAAWNVTVAAIVTAWAIGLACAALFCIGVVPGVFYAILVSAHATSALSSTGTDQPAR